MKTNLKQTTTNDINAPTQHIHHHHSNNGPLVIKIMSSILLIILAWPIGVFVLDKAGFNSPEKTLANIIIIAIVGTIFLIIINQAISDKYQLYLEHKERMADKELQRLRHLQIMQNSAVSDSRQLNPDRQKLIKCCIAVLVIAYDHHAINKKNYSGQYRPWSRRSASAIIIDGKPAGSTIGGLVGPFLKQNNIIINDQLNLNEYPNLNSVQQLFYQPATINPTNKLPTNVNWSIIE